MDKERLEKKLITTLVIKNNIKNFKEEKSQENSLTWGIKAQNFNLTD